MATNSIQKTGESKQYPNQNANKHFSIEPLTDGVYAAIARDGGAAISNAAVIDLGDSTLVVDTFVTPTAGEFLRAEAQRLTGRIPRFVFNTHFHNDHIWGNQAFLPEADIISTTDTRALIETAGIEEYNGYHAISSDRLSKLLAQQAAAETEDQRASFDKLIGFFSGLELDFPRLRVILPNLVFEKRMVLYGSRRRVELIEFLGAHTGSDSVVYLPEDKIVIMSDLLFIGQHPYVGNGDPDVWLEVLRSIRNGAAGIQNASRFVPGHGPVGNLGDLTRLGEYITSCQKIARELIAEGKTSSADIDSTPVPEAFSGWAMPHFFYANLRFLLEKYQGPASGSEATKVRSASNTF